MSKENEATPVKQWKKMFVHGGKTLALLGFVTALALVVMAAYIAAYAGKIVPGVKIVGLEVGNMTGEMAASLLERRIGESGLEVLTLEFDEEEWSLVASEVGAEVDMPATINKAWMVSRTGGLLERFGQAQRSYFEGVSLGLEVKIDGGKWDMAVASISAQIDDPEIKPSFLIRKTGEERVTAFEQGKDGVWVDGDALKKMVSEHWSWLDGSIIEVPVRRVAVVVSEEQAEASRGLASGLINKELVVKIDDDEWRLGDEELVEMVSPANGKADKERVREKVDVFAEAINRQPQNAMFKFESGRVEEFAPGKDGLEVKVAELVERISEVIENFGEEEKREIDVPVTRTKPVVSTAEVNDLGIDELIGVGKSTYFHSIPNRVHNVGLAAKRLSGVLVAPGEVFSFNGMLGEVSQATGYKTAYVISNGRTVLGDGGGVCQVSTTLFRAIMDAGLPVVERKAHAYRVSYYEQDSSPGIDATVYSPTVDLKFRNDTPAHLLIQAIVDEPNRALRFEIYGTDDGRKSYVSEPVVWGQSAPPPPLYQDDPTLPAGTVKQIDWAAWGAKTSFKYKVVREGEVLQDETFYSNYRPWQAVYLRGTATQ